MAKPPTKLAVRMSMRALIMIVNRPNVMILIGRVSRSMIGRIIAFTSPSTNDAITAADKFITVKPGTT